jgi:uncharacterized protein
LTDGPDFDKYSRMFLITGLIRLLFIAFVLYVIFAAVRFIQAIGKPPGERRRPRTLGGTMVKDEFCETYLPREEALREVHGGKEHFFCSRECREGYLKRAEPEGTSGKPEPGP